MKGTARLAGGIRGRGYRIGSATARGMAIGVISASRAMMMSPVRGDGSRTRGSGLLHFLQVSPTEPQNFVWMVPVVGIDYTITTSTNLDWQIK